MGANRLEMFARIFALGFWRGPSAYLRDNYNKLDFAVVVASWALKIVGWEGIYQPIYPGARHSPALGLPALVLSDHRGLEAKITTGCRSLQGDPGGAVPP